MQMTILGIVVPTIAGYLLIASIMGNRATFVERLSLAYPAGLSATTIILFLAGWARIPFAASYVLGAMATLATASAAAMAMRHAKPLNLSSGTTREYQGMTLATKAITGILLTWLAAKITIAAMAARSMPTWSPDSRCIWTVRAAMFYDSLGLHLSPNDYFFKSIGQPTYPLFSQLSQVWFALCTGSFDKTTVKMWVPALFASLGMLSYATARRAYSIPGSLLAATLVLGAPLMAIHATEPYSDLPLSLFYAAMAIYAWRHMEEPEGLYSAAIAGLFGAFALNTKLEAMVYVAVVTVSFAVWAIRRRPATKAAASLASYLAPYLIMVPYFTFKYLNHIGYGQAYYEARHVDAMVPLSKITMFPLIFSYAYLPDNLNLIATAALVALLFMYYKSPPRIANLNYMLVPFFAYIAFFIALYTLSVPHRDFLGYGTIFYRNMLTAYPAAMFITFTLHCHLTHAQGNDGAAPTATAQKTTA